jgi:hypothetical protein
MLVEDAWTASVAFSGGRSGVSDLTWGQWDSWEIIHYLAPEEQRTNLVLDVDIPEGVGVERICQAVRALFLRHESLRTRFRVQGSGGPGQELLSDGEISLHGWSVSRRLTAETVSDLRGRLASKRFDVLRGPLVRIAVADEGEQPRSLIMCLSHLLGDGRSMDTLREDLRGLLGTGEAPGRVTDAGVQPLDQAAFESSGHGRSVNERALRYRRSRIARFPPSPFAPAVVPGSTPRYRAGILESEAVGRAAHVLAARHGVGPHSVMTAAFAMILGTRAGASRFGAHLVSANRFRRGTERAVGQFSGSVPVVVDLTPRSFRELLRYAHAECVEAYSHGLCDAREAIRIDTSAADDQGAQGGWRCVMNFWLPPGAGADEPDSLRRESEHGRFFMADGGADRERITAYIQARPGQLLLFADTRAIPVGFFEPCLRRVEEFLLLAAVNDMTPQQAERRARQRWPQ